MSTDQTSVRVTRRIEAPAARIFAVLADPRHHPDFDGSSEFTGDVKMLQGALSDNVISGVGDVFAMKMYMEEIGNYVMLNHVVQFEQDRRIGWEPSPGDAAASEDGKYPIGIPAGHRWSYELVPDGPNATFVTEIYDDASAPADLREATEEGRAWIDTLTATLARLDDICTS